MTRYERRYFEMLRILISTCKHELGYAHVPKWLKPAIRSHAEHYAKISHE